MTDALLEWLRSMGEATNSPVVLGILLIAAGIEYVVPPFPGDSIVLLGGILVGAFGWSIPLVFAAIMLGSLAGSLAAFALGTRLLAKNPALARGDGKVASLVAAFERRGSWLLVLNRFVPGLRPLFFVAAGLAGMSAKRVALLSAVSAALWNACIMIAGAMIGDNLERLENLLRQYSTAAWVLIALIALVFGIRALIRRRSKP